MVARQSTSPPPPRPYFTVSQRLFRGYGPLAAFAVLLLLMAVAVPSRTQPATTVGAGGLSGAGGPGTPEGVASGVPASGGASGGAGIGSTGSGGAVPSSGAGGTSGSGGGSSSAAGGTTGTAGGGTAAAAAAVAPCTDRKEQVPGDPYSPPCFTFSGNNGGATWQGVTPTEIHVAFRVLNEKGFEQTLAELAGASLSDTPNDIKRTVTALADYFNSRYQFYGRKIVFDFYNGVGSNTNELLGMGQDKAEADATTVAKQIKAFADMSATSEPYADALARYGVLGFGDPYLSRQWHVDHRPYIWSIAADGTKVASFAAQYEVAKLCPQGSLAVYAGGDLKGKPRKFASLAPENSWYQESVQVARGIITSGGCDPGLNVEYQLDLGTMSNQAANIIAKLQSNGVTTILCGCDPILPVFLSGVAARQNYFPEFIITGTALTDNDIVGQLWNQSFASHAFGISPNNDPVPSTQTLGYAAYKTMRNDEPAFAVDLIYYQMAQMAIGLQMAGPHLTPASFEQGMFAFPPKEGPAGLWGFGPGNYTIANDVREIYWDPNAISKYNQKQGAYVGTSNQRWTEGQIPHGPPGVPVH